MGRFADTDPILDGMLQAVAQQSPDFDIEIIEDLTEAVGEDELWLTIIQPAVHQLAARIGVPIHRKLKQVSGPDEDPQVSEMLDALGEAAEPSNVAMVQGTCPHCNGTFMSTLEAVANEAVDTCPHCGKEFMQSNELHPPKGGGE